ncbi:MAG: hypothetical protein K0S46_1858 [Moraxellaceae bacterium]|jgi:hypothetical protein|nr:hypothetical protein [Moraxellaceae bacterium]
MGRHAEREESVAIVRPAGTRGGIRFLPTVARNAARLLPSRDKGQLCRYYK